MISLRPSPFKSIHRRLRAQLSLARSSVADHLHEKAEVVASATVRMLARQHQINLQQLNGTGKKGRILKDDIVFFLQDRTRIKPINLVGRTIVEPPVETTQNTQPIKVQMSQSEKQLHKLSSHSTTVPTLYLQQTFDLTQVLNMISLYTQHKNNISLLSILVKTFSLALLQHPRINSTYSIDHPFNFQTHHTQNLIIPVYQKENTRFANITHLQTLSIHQIQNNLTGLEKHSLPNKIKQTIGKATVIISNLGSIGGKAINPLIIGDQCCHASIGKAREIVASSNGHLRKQSVVDVTLGCDHRVLDGASVARFALSWKQLSQNPTLAFLNMV